MQMKTIKNVLLLALLLPLGAAAQIQWHDPLDADVPYVNGRAWNAEIGKSYARMPDRMEKNMPKAVWRLSRQSAGLSVLFRTTAEEISVRFKVTNIAPSYRNMAPLNHSGVDLYAMDVDGAWHWIGNHMKYSYPKQNGDTLTFSFKGIKPRGFAKRGLEYRLILPMYNTVTWLEVGVPGDSKFQFFRESQEKPIVAYGTSILHGASPSRPGLAWTHIVQRELGYPVVNLGFSGSALLEPELFDAMSEVDACCYIVDAIPNSHGMDEKITQRVLDGVKKLRAKSQAPILLVESCGSPDTVFTPAHNSSQENGNRYLRKAYEALQSAGEKEIYYLSKQEIGFTEDAMIEGTHPNDIGMRQYADAYMKKLKIALRETRDGMANKCFTVCKQRRDGCYEWSDRHNEIIALNRTTDPEVLVIGNSITHFWGGEPRSRNEGGDTWQKLFGKHRAVNMGMGWDRVENVQWRLLHGELDGCHPKQICLLIGVNNTGKNTPLEIMTGVLDNVKIIRNRQPQAQVHVVCIYPARNREKLVAEINDLLKKNLANWPQVQVHDLTDVLTLKDGSGKIDPECFLKDGLHPNEKGYSKLAKAYKKFLF